MKINSKTNIIGVIQARMNSSRLPGKVLNEILGKPVLWHIYQRLKQSKLLDDVVISTGPENKNKEICDFAKNENIKFFSGSETDVVDRFYETAKHFDASAIVRITADCPFVDPVIVDTMLTQYISTKGKYDVVMNSKIHSYPHGLEVQIYPFETLKKLHSDIKDPELRDWFIVYIEKNPNDFNVLNIAHEKNLSKFRLTIDYPEDYEFTKLVYQELYKENHIFLLDEIIELLSQRPDLVAINAKYVGLRNIDAPK